MVDLICVNVGFYMSNWIVFGVHYPALEPSALFHWLMNIFWIVAFLFFKLGQMPRERKIPEHINDALTAVVFNVGAWFAVWFFLRPDYYPRSHIFYAYTIMGALFISWRVLWLFMIRHYRTKGYNIRLAVVLGNGRSVQNLLRTIEKDKGLGYRLIGVHEDTNWTDLGFLDRFIKDHPIDIIFCSMEQFDDRQLQQVMNLAESRLVKLKMISPFSRLSSPSMGVQYVGGSTVLNVNEIPLDYRINRFFKRSFDLLFASIFAVLIFPWLLPIVALLIKLESRGPVFFKQLRHGRGNQPFYCYKFRTMKVNAEADTKQATKGDSRITKVGAILRKTSIDELPQFINVIIGDMSVVGPRPHPLKLNESFESYIEKFAQRHAIKPGITGLAQAKGFRGETAHHTDMSSRVRLDRFYVKRWSLWLDFKILVLTIYSILNGNENAY